MLSSEQHNSSFRLNYRATIMAVFLAFIVVGLGAFTRLSDAGLGCPDWPGCYGHLTWPDSQQEKAAAEKLFPDTPVDTKKTWPEMVHRYFAGGLGLLILFLAVTSIRQRRMGLAVPLKLPIALLVLVVVQAAFGMWTVTLKLLPQVVTAHLLGGFSTLALLWLLSLRLRRLFEPAFPSKLRGPSKLAILLLAAVIFQIALGGWTSSNYAALACADLPTCQGQWWPAVDFARGFDINHPIGANYEGGVLDMDARTAIHLAHRLGAALVSALGLLLIFRLWKKGFPALSQILLLALLAQVALGLSNIWFALPLAVAVAHNVGGAILLLVLVKINYRLFKNNQIVAMTRVSI